MRNAKASTVKQHHGRMSGLWSALQTLYGERGLQRLRVALAVQRIAARGTMLCSYRKEHSDHSPTRTRSIGELLVEKCPHWGGEEPEGGRMSDAGCPTEVVVAMAPATCTGPLCQALALYCSDASKATDGRRCSATLGSLSQATTSLKRSGFKDVQSDRAQSTWWREHDC